jgi:exodeoxyribonuclease VII small subunit
LEESLKKFEKGVKLTRECQDQLAKAELKVKKLMISEEGEEQLEDYVVTEED